MLARYGWVKQKVIAIVPSLGIDAKTVTPSSSPTLTGSGEVPESFSAVLEQATFSPGRGIPQVATSSSGSQVTVPGNLSRVSGTTTREARASDFVTSPSQGCGDTLSRTPAGKQESQSAAVPLVAGRSTPAPALNSKIATQDFTTDDLVAGADGQVLVRVNSAAVSGTTKREGKPSDSATGPSQGRSDTTGRTTAGKEGSPMAAVPLLVVQSAPAPALNWKLATQDFRKDDPVAGAARNQADVNDRDLSIVEPTISPSIVGPSLIGPGVVDPSDVNPRTVDPGDKRASLFAEVVDSTGKPEAMSASTITGALCENLAPSLPQGDTSLQEPANANANIPTTRPAAALASLMTPQVGAPVGTSSPVSKGVDPKGTDSKNAEPKIGETSPSSSLRFPFGTDGLVPSPKPSAGSATLPVRDVSRGCSGTAEDDHQTPVLAKSEDNQFAVSLNVAPSVLPLPLSAPVDVDSYNSQGTIVKPALDQSRIGGIPLSASRETVVTAPKNVDTTVSAKDQSRKDDSFPSANSPAADQSQGSVAAKGPEVSSFFSLSGNQESPSIGDAKNASAGSSAKPSDQQTGQSSQESTGVAQGQTQLETPAAYPSSLINSAKLIARIGEAELRLGIRAGEFGSVDIRTSMVRNQFTAEISVERSELGRAMAAELPSLQDRLTEHRVPVANITLQNHGGSHSTASQQQKPRDGQQVYATNSVSRGDEVVMAALVATEGTTSASRLDVHM